MNKTILLGYGKRLSAEGQFWACIVAGSLGFLSGIFHYSLDAAHPIGLILGLILISLGIGYVIYAILAYTERSKYAPKVSVDERIIHVKEKLLRPGVKIPWSKIKGVQMGPYQIVITLPEEDFDFSYRTTADTSISIKSAIREIAESKHIEVIGG